MRSNYPSLCWRPLGLHTSIQGHKDRWDYGLGAVYLHWTAKNPKLQFCDFKGQLNGITVVTIMPTESATLPQTTVEFLDNTQVTEYIKS